MYNSNSVKSESIRSFFRLFWVLLFLVPSLVVLAQGQSDSVKSRSIDRPQFLPAPPPVVNRSFKGRVLQAPSESPGLILRDIASPSKKESSDPILYNPIETPSIFTPKVEESQFYTYFEVNNYKVNLDFMDNASQYSRMGEFFNRLQVNSHLIIDSIVVYGAASPEGDLSRNEFLARERCNAVKRYILNSFPGIDSRKILTYSKGEDWSGLRSAVENDPNVPQKADVLGILDVSSSRENREYFLRRLGNGVPWRYISEHILPYLRNGISSQVYYREYPFTEEVLAQSKKPSKQKFLQVISSPAVESHIEPKKMVSDTVFLYSKPDTIRIVEYIKDTVEKIKKVAPVTRPLWSLKTNLLYWAALQANVEAEFYFGTHWSLNFEYQIAWWKNASKHQYYQYTQCGPEGRYWFKGDGNFRGHYVGLHVGFGIYDLSWGNGPEYQGYQGEFAIALGLSYGYVWKIGKILHLEAGFGFGYIMTEYRRYRYIDQCYVYQGTERMQFLGPTKARLALQWRIGTGVMGGKKNKKGGASL